MINPVAPVANSSQVCRILNRLIQLHARSLAVYLRDARPFDADQHAREMEVLNSIAADQLETVDVLAEEVLSREQKVDRGAFPMRFTSLNDLSIKYLIRMMSVQQQEQISTLEQAVTDLEPDAAAQRVALEALGASQAHLDMLRELQRQGIA